VLISLLTNTHIHTYIQVHSSIPFSEQLNIFAEDEECVKICIATNAAESSLTIPDCNNVICFGLEKRVLYSAKRHRTELVQRWISKASATQRAGRTGRVRPGTVWRLYGKEFFEDMDDYAPPGMLTFSHIHDSSIHIHTHTYPSTHTHVHRDVCYTARSYSVKSSKSIR